MVTSEHGSRRTVDCGEDPKVAACPALGLPPFTTRCREDSGAGGRLAEGAGQLRPRREPLMGEEEMRSSRQEGAGAEGLEEGTRPRWRGKLSDPCRVGVVSAAAAPARLWPHADSLIREDECGTGLEAAQGAFLGESLREVGAWSLVRGCPWGTEWTVQPSPPVQGEGAGVAGRG